MGERSDGRLMVVSGSGQVGTPGSMSGTRVLSADAATPRVAVEVAARQLRALGIADDVDPTISWAGPLELAVTDESSVQAACGVMAVHGRRAGRPEPLHVPYASVLAGVLAAQGVLAVLVDRARGGPARQVTTSVAQAALLAVSQYLAAATTGDDPIESSALGGPPFTSADGTRFEIETLAAEDWARFWALLGAEPAAVRHGWPPFQSRYATATCPLPDGLFDAARRHPYEAVSAAGAAAGVSVAPVDAVPLPVSEPACRISPIGGRTTRAPRPDALPLHGFVVVEATRRVQGPLAGQVLRWLGAEVVRIEPPGGDPLRGVPPMAGEVSARFLALNHGKRVVESDLGAWSGRAVVRELVADADVFLHNWGPGRAQRWDLTAGDLAAVRPGLVYAHASGWGDAFGADPPIGTDYMVQSHSGLAARVGRGGAPPAPSLLTLTDVLGGLVCAEGVLAGLLGRLRTGYGRRVGTSLLSAAGILLRAPRHVPVAPAIPVLTDLAELAGDPRFAPGLAHDGCALVRPPWKFRP